MLYHHIVVIKEWRDVVRDVLCQTTLLWRHITGMREKTHQCKQRKQSDCLMFIHSSYVSWIHGHILISKDIVSIYPATVRSTFLFKKKRCQAIVVTLKVIDDVKLVKERQQIKWHHAQNVVTLRVLLKFVNFNWTLVICLILLLLKC